MWPVLHVACVWWPLEDLSGRREEIGVAVVWKSGKGIFFFFGNFSGMRLHYICIVFGDKRPFLPAARKMCRWSFFLQLREVCTLPKGSELPWWVLILYLMTPDFWHWNWGYRVLFLSLHFFRFLRSCNFRTVVIFVLTNIWWLCSRFDETSDTVSADFKTALIFCYHENAKSSFANAAGSNRILVVEEDSWVCVYDNLWGMGRSAQACS